MEVLKERGSCRAPTQGSCMGSLTLHFFSFQQDWACVTAWLSSLIGYEKQSIPNRICSRDSSSRTWVSHLSESQNCGNFPSSAFVNYVLYHIKYVERHFLYRPLMFSSNKTDHKWNAMFLLQEDFSVGRSVAGNCHFNLLWFHFPSSCRIWWNLLSRLIWAALSTQSGAVNSHFESFSPLSWWPPCFRRTYLSFQIQILLLKMSAHPRPSSRWSVQALATGCCLPDSANNVPW